MIVFFFLFYGELISQHNKVKSWSTKAKIFLNGICCVKQIFIPINLGLHWICACIDTEKYVLYMYDSLCVRQNYDFYFDQIEQYFQIEYGLHCVCKFPKCKRINLSSNIFQWNSE